MNLPEINSPHTVYLLLGAKVPSNQRFSSDDPGIVHSHGRHVPKRCALIKRTWSQWVRFKPSDNLIAQLLHFISPFNFGAHTPDKGTLGSGLQEHPGVPEGGVA